MKKTIILVDDNKDLTFSIKESLESVDPELKIIRTHSGDECLKKINKIKPDVFILDIMMPKMNGWELSLKIKGDPRVNDVPIVFLTAIEDANCKRFGLTLGVDYIMKPFNTKELYKVIANAIKK